LPRSETYTKVLPGTADVHHTIADAHLAEAARVVDDATALDAAVDVLDAHAAAGDTPIRGFLRARERSATRLPGGHDDVDLVERKRQEAKILKQTAARGQGIGRGIRNPLIVGAADIGVTQKEDRERRVDPQHVFHRVAFFLAAITARLFNRVLGALKAPFGAIVPKRGKAGTGVDAAAGRVDAVGDTGVGTNAAAAAASATLRRGANSFTDRAGASPSARRVACRTPNRT
jgi:hypothetical protein